MNAFSTDQDRLGEVLGALPIATDRQDRPNWVATSRELDRMIRRLDFASMRSLEAVCEHGSISRAAQAESLTASAISKRIKELEAVLGVELLRRSHDGIRPSRAGRILLQHWSEIKVRMYALAECVRAVPVDGESRLLLVCDERLFDFLCVDLLARPELFELARQIDVVPTSQDVSDTVIELEADIGVALAQRSEAGGGEECDPPSEGSVTSSMRFAPTAYVAICRKDHPLAQETSLSAAALEPYDVWPLAGAQRIVRSIEQSVGVALCTNRAPRSLRLSNALSILDSVDVGAVLIAPVSSRWQCPWFANITTVELKESWARVEVDVTFTSNTRRADAAIDAVNRIFR